MLGNSLEHAALSDDDCCNGIIALKSFLQLNDFSSSSPLQREAQRGRESCMLANILLITDLVRNADVQRAISEINRHEYLEILWLREFRLTGSAKRNGSSQSLGVSVGSCARERAKLHPDSMPAGPLQYLCKLFVPL